MKNDKNVILTIVITIVIGVAMFMALTSWVTQSPCPLLRPIGEFVHHWWTAIPSTCWVRLFFGGFGAARRSPLDAQTRRPARTRNRTLAFL